MAGGYISQKTGADIKIGQLLVTPDFTVKIKDFQTNDLNNNNLLKFKSLKVTPCINDIIENKLHFKNIEIDSLSGNIVRYEGDSDFNFNFLAEFFSSSEKKEEDNVAMPTITIDKIKLKGINFEYWDQDRANFARTPRNTMNYDHIDAFGIDLDAQNIVIDNGVRCKLSMLKAEESSGFIIKRLSSMVDFSSKGIILDSLEILTNNSDLDLDLHMLYNDFNGFNDFLDSVWFDAKIRKADILLSDIGHFADIMYEMPDRFLFQGVMNGPISDFTAKDIVFDYGDNTHFEGAIGFDGLPDFFECDMFIDVDKMDFSYSDIEKLRIPGMKDGRIPLPEQLAILGKGTLEANFKGSYYDFEANAEATTEAGNVIVDIVMSTNQASNERDMSGCIKGENIMLGKIANLEPAVGDLDLDIQYNCIMGDNKTKLLLNGDVYDININGEKINDTYINGSLEDNIFDGRIKVNDQLAKLDFNGNINFQKPQNIKADFTADIEKVDLYRLHVTNDTKALVKANIQANFNGHDIDDIEGDLSIDSLVYDGDKGHYIMKELTASVKNDELMQRKMTLNCDFADIEIGGKINFAALPTNMMQYLNHYSEFPYLIDDIEQSGHKDTEQDFYINTNIIDASLLCTLFLPELTIAPNTTFNGTFTSKSNLLNMTLRSNYIKYGDLAIDSVELRNTNGDNSSILSLKAKSLLPDGTTDSTTFGLNDISIFSMMANDSIYTNLKFNGHQLPDRNKVTLKTKFKAGETEFGRFVVSDADILIDNTKWFVTEDNFIDFRKNESTVVNNITLFGDGQTLKINGKFPFQNSDTLSLSFDNFNFSTIDFLTNQYGLNFDGIINGSASVSGMNQTMSIFANLAIDTLAFNGDHYGNAKILSYWDNNEKSIHIVSGIKDNDIDRLSLRGVYYPNEKYDNMEFRLVLNDLRLSIIEPFTKGIVDKVNGTGSGRFDIIGTLKAPIIEGNLNVKEGGCHIDFLNTYYTFSPKVKLSENLIEFENMALTDSLGNTAFVKGNITHNYLNDFNFNLEIYMREFLALATSASDNSDFYGTAFASGLVEVKGPIDDINLFIKAATRKGTDFTVPLNNSNTVKSNNYIVFTNKKADDSIASDDDVTTKKQKIFNIDLDLSVDENAQLHIILPDDIGSIKAKGNGNIKIGVTSAGDFALFGSYIIDNGSFDLTLQEILRKNFSLEKGGVISFSGDPLDSDIDVSGVYQCKAALSSAGITTDSISKMGNVNVESIIYLRNKLMNPDIKFGMRLPNAKEDLQQSIFSVIDTTSQAVMTQQTLSLLVLNSFSNSDSFISGLNSGSISILTSQINNWLSQISRHFDIGFNYKPGDEITDEEFQIALRTQLFNDILTIESNFGFINQSSASSSTASSIVGEVDIYVRLTRSGNLTIHAYNHSNNNTSLSNFTYDRTSPYTQGIGISYNRTFDRFSDLFKRKNKKTTTNNRRTP